MSTAKVGPDGGLVGPGGGLVGPGTEGVTLTPSPVTIPILTVAPAVLVPLNPSPVAIPILTVAPVVSITTILTPDPVAIPIVLPIPYLAYAGRVDLRLTQLAVEIALTPDVTPTLVTTVGAEVIYSGAGAVQVTTAGAEVIYGASAAVQVTTVGAEVIYLEAPRPRQAWATIIDS